MQGAGDLLSQEAMPGRITQRLPSLDRIDQRRQLPILPSLQPGLRPPQPDHDVDAARGRHLVGLHEREALDTVRTRRQRRRELSHRVRVHRRINQRR